MLKPFREYRRLSADGFAKDAMIRGTIVSAKSDDRYIVVYKCNKSVP